MQRSVDLETRAVTLENAQTTLPAPSAPTDGAALGWDDLRPAKIKLRLTAAGAVTLSDGIVYAYEGSTLAWYRLGDLNGGNPVSLTADVGDASTLLEYSGSATRLAIGGSPSAAVAITAIAVPQDVSE